MMPPKSGCRSETAAFDPNGRVALQYSALPAQSHAKPSARAPSYHLTGTYGFCTIASYATKVSTDEARYG